MATLRTLAHRLFRIDPRSLGVFRILFGFVLLTDLCQRWRWITAFYSNDGVLPNHVHLFQLRDHGRVWSALHAFSLKDESFAAFSVTLAFYAFFTLGWYTRVAAIASAVALVSLQGRNILTNGIGDAFAVTVLLVSVFLPLGARYSIDALRHAFATADEHTAQDLDDRTKPEPLPVSGSLAALVLLLVVGVVPLAAALQQKGGAWARGDALYYALRSDRWLSGLGEMVRNKASLGVLTAWTKALRMAEFLVLPLALVPAARRVTRPLAMLALGFVGATFGLLFNYGPYGFTMLAAVALLVPEEVWDARAKGTYPIRVLYDDDCGMCLWLARLLKRLDGRENVRFVANGEVARGEVSDLPAAVTAEAVERSIVVVTPEGVAYEDALALSHIFRALPLCGAIGRFIALPVVKSLFAALYRRVAAKRLDISVACGLGACGVPTSDSEASAQETAEAFPPASALARNVRAALATVGVGVLFLVFLAATEAANALPMRTGLGTKDALLGAASYARITAPWGIWAPEPSARNEALVTVATMRDEKELDILNAQPPDPDLSIPSRHRLGPLWATYAENLRNDDTASFRQELRRYLMRGGRLADDQEQPPGVTKLKTYWVSVPIAPPGSSEPSEPIERVEILDSGALPRPGQTPEGDFGRGPALRNIGRRGR